jgi:hypothetical protein
MVTPGLLHSAGLPFWLQGTGCSRYLKHAGFVTTSGLKGGQRLKADMRTEQGLLRAPSNRTSKSEPMIPAGGECQQQQQQQQQQCQVNPQAG